MNLLTALYFADIHKLVDILRHLWNNENTVIIIKYNLDAFKTTDYIIDIGLEGGDSDGTVVDAGTPEKIIKVENLYTGKYVKKSLEI